MTEQTDFLIVGQGLAGSILAWQLLQHDFKVLVIDSGDENASKVAAGLINPVTGKRFVKSVKLSEHLHSATTFYQQLSDFFNEPLYMEMPMLRLLKNAQERQNLQKRLNDPAYRNWFKPLNADKQWQQATLHAPFGSVMQSGTGYLRTKQLLRLIKKFLIAHDSYSDSAFDYQDIRLNSNTLRWKSITAKKIIFCEGYLIQQNPWFQHLPMQVAKGEILTMQCTAKLPQQILNFGRWLIPQPENIYRTGATYDTKTINCLTTEHAQHSLIASVRTILPELQPGHVIQHQAGIRPCTLDKQPLIGLHPKHPQLAVFNGFGSKGSLQIPYYAQQFCNFLQNRSELPKTSNIKRYYDTHFPD